MDNQMIFYIAMLAVGFLFFIVIPTIHSRRRRREKPSDFAGGVARSLTDDPQSWDYDNNENWVISEKAALEISLQQGNFGRVNSRQRVNIGTTHIVTFDGADRRAFVSALGIWREKTAIERQHVAERRKRDALQAMAA